MSRSRCAVLQLAGPADLNPGCTDSVMHQLLYNTELQTPVSATLARLPLQACRVGPLAYTGRS